MMNPDLNDHDDEEYIPVEIKEPAWTHIFRVVGNDTEGYMIGLSGWGRTLDGEIALGFDCLSYAELEELVEMLILNLNTLLKQVQKNPDVPMLHKANPRPERIYHQSGLSRRFAVFRRDTYRCRICGRSAADGARLEVDHKIPLSKGGPDTYANLWTLCFDCNRGKSDHDL